MALRLEDTEPAPPAFRALDALRAIRSPAGDGLSAYDVALFVVLVSHADGEGRCFPSFDLLALEAKMSRSKAIRSVRALEEAGWLSVRSIRRMTGPANEYTLTPKPEAERAPVRVNRRTEHGRHQEPRPESVVPHSDHAWSPTATEHGSPERPDLPTELPTELPNPLSPPRGELVVSPPAPPPAPNSWQLTLLGEPPPAPTDPAEPAKPSPVEVVFAAYVAGWRSRTPKGTNPPKLTDARRRLISTRLRDFGADDLALACRGVWLSPWHVDNRATDIELALRNAGQVEKFRAFAESPPAAASGPRIVASGVGYHIGEDIIDRRGRSHQGLNGTDRYIPAGMDGE